MTEREVEVLRVVATGRSTKELAGALFISAKTAGHHIGHIYAKIGVSTRAGATLFALQHDLLVSGAKMGQTPEVRGREPGAQ